MTRRVRLAMLGVSALFALGDSAAADVPDRGAWRATFETADERGGESSADVRAFADIVALAESRNPGLRAAFDRWTAKIEQVPRSRALPDPKLSYGYFLESVETRVGPQRQKLGVSQTIPLFKLGSRGDVAASDADVAGVALEARRLELRTRLTRLWADYYHLRRAVEVTEENVSLVAHLESVALSQYAAGIAPHSAVIRSQVELGKLEDRVRTLRDRRHAIVAALNAEMDRPADAPIPWPTALPAGSLELDQDELVALLRASNPSLAAARLRVKRDRARERLAGKSSIPDLTLGAELVDTDESHVPGLADSGKNAAVATATINLPLWFGKYRAERRQAAASRSASERELRHLENRLIAELSRMLVDFRDAERRRDLYADTLLPKAEQSVAATEKSFVAGDARFLDLIDAQRTLLEFQLAHERAIADRAATLAHLDELVGGSLGQGGR